MKPQWMKKDDHILTVYAERCSGHGWANNLYWCVVQDGDKKVRIESLQVREMTEGLRLLFGVAAAIQEAIVAEVAIIEHPPEKGR